MTPCPFISSKFKKAPTVAWLLFVILASDLLNIASTYDLITTALEREVTIQALLDSLRSNDSLDYDPIYAGQSDWQLLPPLDHPTEPARCLVSGTGLTHMGSAKSRNAMHCC